MRSTEPSQSIGDMQPEDTADSQRSSLEEPLAFPHAGAGDGDSAAISSSPPVAVRSGWHIRRAAWVFWLMFAINTLNYLDRLIVVAVGPTLKAQFNLTDSAIGWLGSAFLLVYTLAALPLGLLADLRISRAKVVSAGVALWSLMSGGAAFALGFGSLCATRALVGVGEASYYPAGTAILSAYYSREQRARVMSRWQVGQLLGTALAFAISAAFFAWFPAHLAWRVAFLVTGLPGLALAALMWFVDDTPQGTPHRGGQQRKQDMRSVWETARAHIAQVVRIRTLWLVIALQALSFLVITPAVTFLTIYVRSEKGPFHLSASHAALITGLLVVGGGVCGVLLGGYVSDWLGRRFVGGRVLAACIGFALAIPCYTVMLLTHALPVFVVAGILTVLALNLPAGPLTAVTQDATPPALRATAVAIAGLFSHLLGDVWASSAVGILATALHEREALALLIVGAPALAIGVVVAWLGARTYSRDAHH
ncbi:MAG: MFS transporter [Ktedonobacterales bacterium]